MNLKMYLPIVALLVLSAACSLPGSTDVQPTMAALPPTPNLPFAASPEPQSVPSSSTFREEFDGKISPGTNWTWLRNDPSNWSLSASPGWLRINLSTISYLSGLPVNVLTRPAPAGDFDLRTSLRFTPARNFEAAGLIVLFDETSVLQFTRAYCDFDPCAGSGYYFDNLQNGSVVGGNFGVSGSSGESVLRLVRKGNSYTAYYQVDGVNWIQIGSHTINRQPVSLGLIAAQAQSPGAYADFDYLEVIE